MAGLSAGGYLAASLAFTYPTLTHELGIFSAPIRDFGARFPAAAAKPEAINQELPLIWIGVGSSDPSINDWNRQFDRELTADHINHRYQETEGGHDYAVWRWCLVQFAPLVFRSDH